MNQDYQTYLTVSWEQVLCDNDDISELFEALAIKDLKSVQILSRSYSKDGRMIINVTADNADDKSLRIIIDSTSGIPTWQQFINVTYDQGESADIRIILYGEDDREYGNGSTAGGIIEIGNLVRRNNQCGVITYLVNGVAFNAHGQKIIDGCFIEERPNEVRVDPTKISPSKRQVQEAEFWAGYYFPQRENEYIEIDEDIISDWAPGYSIRKDLRTMASWNDDGFFIKLLEEKPSDEIHWIWNNKKSEFEAAYPNCDIIFEKIDEKRYAISVRMLNISMTDLINTTPKEKWDYGDYVFVQEQVFYELAEDIAEDYNKMIKAAAAV